MPSKFDRLRAGEVVEIEPGRKGRLNNETRSFETSDGRTMFVGNDPDFYPANESALAHSREKEQLQREIKRTPGGEFLYQFGNQGIAGATKDWYNRLTKKGEDYIRSRQVNAEVGSQISENSPWTSGAATAASFIPDIAATGGMSALKAAPLLSTLHSGSRVLDEPEQVAGEAMLSAAGGFLIDKGASALSRMANRRGQVRELPKQIAAANEANLAQNEKFNALKRNAKSINESRLQQHQADLNKRQNTILQEQNAYEQRKLQRDAEVVRLKNEAEIAKAQRSANAAQADAEYRTAKAAADSENKSMAEKFKLDQEQYQRSLKQLPELQKKAQQEYSENVIKNAESISDAFPKDSRINSSQLGVNQFIENSIAKSSLAGSREANQSSRILKSIFPEGELLTSKELASRYRSLEGAIQKASPEVKQVLNDFKTHLGDKLPSILTDNIAYSRVVPSLRKQIEKEVSKILDVMQLAESGVASRSFLKNRINQNVNQLFRELTPQEFMQKMQNGEIKQQIMKGIVNPNDFSSGGLASLKPGRKTMNLSSADLEKLGINIPNPSQAKFDEFTSLFSIKLDKALAQAEMKMIAVEVDAAKKLGGKIKKTLGVAEPIQPPNAPMVPEPIPGPMLPKEQPPLPPTQLPPPVAPPNVPPVPPKPTLMDQPLPPNAIPTPTLPPAQGMLERGADFLEQPILGRNGSGPLNNPLVKLGGLKYLLGKAALPAEAAYVGMKALTSPTSTGEALRMTFKQGGIEAIDNWARKYPSYQNGILQSPQDRRSLTKEVEDDPQIPLEQKAIIQSKINRGKNLQDRL